MNPAQIKNVIFRRIVYRREVATEISSEKRRGRRNKVSFNLIMVKWVYLYQFKIS